MGRQGEISVALTVSGGSAMLPKKSLQRGLKLSSSWGIKPIPSRGGRFGQCNRERREYTVTQKAKVLKNFDMEALRKERARKAASGGIDLESAIAEIGGGAITRLNPGETAQIPLEGDASDENRVRKNVMNITAKLNNLTYAGAPWAGRQYKVMSDGEEFVYVQRGDDLPKSKHRQRKVRQARSETPSEAGQDVAQGETVSVEGGAIVKERETENA